MNSLRIRRRMNVSNGRYILGSTVLDHGEPVTIPSWQHLLIVGESGSGKGSAIANIIRQEVARKGRIYFIDLKGGMESAFYEKVLSRQAITLEEAENLLANTNQTIDERANKWAGRIRQVTDNEETHYLLIVDEASDLIRTGSEKKQSDNCVRLLRSILSRSRALNMTVIVSTQNPRISESLPYRSLLLNTLALRLNSRSEAIMAMGQDAVENGAQPWSIPSSRPGDAYLWDTEANSVKYLHIPYMSDAEIAALKPMTPRVAKAKRGVIGRLLDRGYYDTPCEM